jgi:hypothetical protein
MGFRCPRGVGWPSFGGRRRVRWPREGGLVRPGRRRFDLGRRRRGFGDWPARHARRIRRPRWRCSRGFCSRSAGRGCLGPRGCRNAGGGGGGFRRRRRWGRLRRRRRLRLRGRWRRDPRESAWGLFLWNREVDDQRVTRPVGVPVRGQGKSEQDHRDQDGVKRHRGRGGCGEAPTGGLPLFLFQKPLGTRPHVPVDYSVTPAVPPPPPPSSRAP